MRIAALILLGLPFIQSFSVVHNGRTAPLSASSLFRDGYVPGAFQGSWCHSHRSLFSVGTDDDRFVEADDLPAIQKLFSTFCDSDGLMTKAALEKMPTFKDMLADGDLLAEELDDIWDAAPKFPDVGGEDTRIDVDSFVQIYRDVDDLFEEEDEDDGKEQEKEPTADEELTVGESEISEDDSEVEAELEQVYESLCDKDKLVSKSALLAWGEVQKLLDEGLLGEDEFDELWDKTSKSPGSNDQLDVDGFLSFNVALDSLFEFTDEEEDGTDNTSHYTRPMVKGDDLPPGVLFASIADEDYQVGMEELQLWVELKEMIDEGELLSTELQDMYDSIEKTESGKLNEEAFVKLFNEIEALFEEVEEDELGSATTTSPPARKVKDDLLSFIEIVQDDDKEALPCGLDSSEADQKQVLNIIKALEEQPTNLISQKKGEIALTDLAGTWELLYSSSSAMKFNKGLSGLGGSFPNGKFGGVKQKLTATKFLTDLEYVERIEVTPSSASFDVMVTGGWDLRTSVSLFTGKPTIVLNLEPERVNYGPTSTRADHWKSLGPLNRLDVSYLDEDLRVMRGCTSADTVFVWKKVL